MVPPLSHLRGAIGRLAHRRTAPPRGAGRVDNAACNLRAYGLTRRTGPTGSSPGSDACGDPAGGGTAREGRSTSDGSMKQEAARHAFHPSGGRTGKYMTMRGRTVAHAGRRAAADAGRRVLAPGLTHPQVIHFTDLAWVCYTCTVDADDAGCALVVMLSHRILMRSD